MNEFDLSIVIVNWNTKHLLKDCLDSVRKYTNHMQYEITVIDNASIDGSVEMLKSDYPFVKLKVNEENEGFSKANNKGIREATGEFILLLNSDTFIRENVFLNLVKLMKENPSVGVCFPRFLNLEGKTQTARTWSMTPFQSFMKIINCYKTKNNKRLKLYNGKDLIEAENVGGACFMVRKRVFDEIGLLDENYFVYNEEDDFCRRVGKTSWEICYIPSLSIYHHQGGSYSSKSAQLMVRVKAYESDMYFFKKHYNWLTARLLKGTYKIVITMRLLFLLLRYIKSLLQDGDIWLVVKNEWKLLWLKN
jgi:GT2 family glycosyltransferase